MEGARRPTVAVIGAGVSGLTAAKQLQSFSLGVTVFERASAVGGIWSFDERKPLEPPYPSLLPSLSDYDDGPSQLGLGGDPPDLVELQHAPPGPAYESLTNNIPTSLLELQGYPWPDGTGDYVSHRVVWGYLQRYAVANGLEPLIKFNTRVEKLEKEGQRWSLQTSTLERDELDRSKIITETSEFDAVVVATGHYHAPRIPDFPGLPEWKRRWPSRVFHSKAFRTADCFENLLLIGAGVSATDIAKEASTHVKKIYQVCRGSASDIPAQFLPENAERVGPISSFSAPSEVELDGILHEDAAIPATVTLNDGRILDDIHTVILCTGYHITYPFLKQFHSDSTPVQDADERVLVTDGTQIHNLHEDIFYIPDPTLAFVGTAFSASSFSLFEFQSIAISAVFSGNVKLPPREVMRARYKERLAKKGAGKMFHSLRDDEVDYVARLVLWLNSDLALSSDRVVEGHSEAWLRRYHERKEWLASVFRRGS
ncbi:uncharacterized protein BJX67DRAFT_373965 [Aspergillus lucknowensis]|uniref:FAD/NAD(P)-binding domain-containing protein n=1 Tax=Aspergillus lucknowensis TaxID=176173 RepID=A0ABR4LI70_9EURO